MLGSEGAANVLQLATQAATPHQREAEHDFLVASFYLLLPLILAIAILETNGTAGFGNSDFHSLSALGRKRRPSHHQLWISEEECQVLRGTASDMTLVYISRSAQRLRAEIRCWPKADVRSDTLNARY